MLPFYSVNFVGMIVFAVFFYRIGLFENNLIYQAEAYKNNRGCPLLWATLSVVISCLILQWLRLGFVGMVLGQVGLFAGIVAHRVLHK